MTALAVLRALPWRLILPLAALLACFALGWHHGTAAAESSHQRALAAQQRAAQEQAQALRDSVASIDAKRVQQLRAAQDEIDDLRSRVAAGSVRLRVAATCPASAGGAGVGDGAAARPDAPAGSAGDAYLDPAAEPAYFALREGIARHREQLLACQDILQAERK